MRLRPDCKGCEIDSNEPAAHEEICNYRHWPGLYDTIERQKQRIEWLEAELRKPRDDRHHEVLCLVLAKAIKPAHPSTFALAVEHARAIADLAYPPPKQEQP